MVNASVLWLFFIDAGIPHINVFETSLSAPNHWGEKNDQFSNGMLQNIKWLSIVEFLKFPSSLILFH